MKSVYTIWATGIPVYRHDKHENGSNFTNSSICTLPKAKKTLITLYLGPCLQLASYIYMYNNCIYIFKISQSFLCMTSNENLEEECSESGIDAYNSKMAQLIKMPSGALGVYEINQPALQKNINKAEKNEIFALIAIFNVCMNHKISILLFMFTSHLSESIHVNRHQCLYDIYQGLNIRR